RRKQHFIVRDGHRLAEARPVVGVGAVAMPSFLASLGIIRPNAERPGQDQVLPAAFKRQKPRRAETAALLARSTPALLAGARLQGDNRGGSRRLCFVSGRQPFRTIIVAVLYHQVPEEKWRRRRPPACFRRENAEAMLPNRRAVHVVTEQAR